MSRHKNRNKNHELVPSGQHPVHSTPSGAQGRTRITGMRAELYAGELPHPDHLERFEALCPGATDRWLTRVERQGEHRQRMENKFLNITGITQILGSIFGGLAVLGGLAAGTFLLYHDKKTEGLTAMFAPLGIIASIFLADKLSIRWERARKLAAERT